MYVAMCSSEHVSVTPWAHSQNSQVIPEQPVTVFDILHYYYSNLLLRYYMGFVRQMVGSMYNKSDDRSLLIQICLLC